MKALSFDFWYTVGRYATDAEWKKQDAIRTDEFTRILANCGIELNSQKVDKVLEEVGAECEDQRLRTEMEIPSRELVKRFLNRLGIRKKVGGGASNLLRSYDEALLKVNIIPEPGAKEVLGELKSRGYLLALLSNTSHGHIIKRIMVREGLDIFFDHLLYTDELGPRKPNPEAFRILLKRLGTAASQTAHVGDRLELDVLGAKRSGLRSVLYQSNRDYCYDGFPHPDFCIKKLEELIAS